mgnify:CR=1 FL=1
MIATTHSSQLISDSLEYFMSMGCKDKHELFSKVAEYTNTPEPTVRRIARDLRNHYQKRINFLQNDSTKNEEV